MAQHPKQLVIIGGGNSINTGLSLGLKERIKRKFTIGCNYAFYYFDHLTMTNYVDREFYKFGDATFTSQQKKNHRESLRNLQLIVGQEVTEKNIEKFLNTYYISCMSKYKRNLKGGIYRANLVGLYSLSLGIYLLDEGEIFLLGYDYCGQNKDGKGRQITHFYQESNLKEINHRGVGRTNYYDMKGRANRDFAPYQKEKKIKIYNVSLNSKIDIFPKISYQEFFKKLDDNTYCQGCLEYMIITKLGVLK